MSAHCKSLVTATRYRIQHYQSGHDADDFEKSRVRLQRNPANHSRLLTTTLHDFLTFIGSSFAIITKHPVIRAMPLVTTQCLGTKRRALASSLRAATVSTVVVRISMNLDRARHQLPASGASRYMVGLTGAIDIIPALKEQYTDCQIFVLDLKSPLTPSHDVEEYFAVDITAEEEVKKILAQIRPHAVVHTAGITTLLHDRYSRRIEKHVRHVNIGGTRVMLSAAKEAGCKAFVFTSSCCVVTDALRGYYANIDEEYPVSTESLMYGESKVEAPRKETRSRRLTRMAT
jgi:hypothetical protein